MYEDDLSHLTLTQCMKPSKCKLQNESEGECGSTFPINNQYRVTMFNIKLSCHPNYFCNSIVSDQLVPIFPYFLKGYIYMYLH